MPWIERHAGSWIRAGIASLILAAHGLALVAVSHRHLDGGRGNSPVLLVSTGEFIAQSSVWDRTPVPEVNLDRPQIDTASLQLVRFDTSVEDELAAVTAAASAPRLSRFQTADVRVFARRAGIGLGHAQTVVLAVQVGEDGLARSADVLRSCGDAAADEAAIDYALELRWIPATRDRQPIATRVLFPVTLSL